MTTTQTFGKEVMQKVYRNGMTDGAFKDALKTELGRGLGFPEVKAANEFFRSQQEERTSSPPRMPEPATESVAKMPRETYFESLGLTSKEMEKEGNNFVCSFDQTGKARLAVEITEERGMLWVQYKEFLGLAALEMGLVGVGKLGLEGRNTHEQHIPLQTNSGKVYLFIEKVGAGFEVHAAYKLDPPKSERVEADPQEAEIKAKRRIIMELMEGKGNFGTVELLESNPKVEEFIRSILLGNVADLDKLTNVPMDALCARANEYAKYKKQSGAPAVTATVDIDAVVAELTKRGIGAAQPVPTVAQVGDQIFERLLHGLAADQRIHAGVVSKIEVPKVPTAEEVAQALLANGTFVDAVVAKLTESKSGLATKVIAGLRATVTEAAKTEVGAKLATTVKGLLETGDELKKAVEGVVEEKLKPVKEDVEALMELATDVDTLKTPVIADAVLSYIQSAINDTKTAAAVADEIRSGAETGFGFEGSQLGLTLSVLTKIANGEYDGAIEMQFGVDQVESIRNKAKEVYQEFKKLVPVDLGGESS